MAESVGFSLSDVFNGKVSNNVMLFNVPHYKNRVPHTISISLVYVFVTLKEKFLYYVFPVIF